MGLKSRFGSGRGVLFDRRAVLFCRRACGRESPEQPLAWGVGTGRRHGRGGAALRGTCPHPIPETKEGNKLMNLTN